LTASLSEVIVKLCLQHDTATYPLSPVCCCGPGGQEISIVCCTAGVRPAKAGSATLSAYEVAEHRLLVAIYICKLSSAILFNSCSLYVIYRYYYYRSWWRLYITGFFVMVRCPSVRPSVCLSQHGPTRREAGPAADNVTLPACYYYYYYGRLSDFLAENAAAVFVVFVFCV